MSSAPDAGLPQITPTELRQRMDREEPLVLLDVREPFEREIADLPAYGQRLIPMGEIPAHLDELDADDPIVVYCRSGARSARIVQFLRASGFSNVLNLKGGILGWRMEVDPSLREY